MFILFQISKSLLTVYPDTGKLYFIHATSGRGKCKNISSEECQKKKFEGPIPVGSYYLSSTDLNDPAFLHDVTRRLWGDWGDWRIPVKPSKTTNTHGRDKFFIHGGGTEGSAGCIDIGGGVLGNKLTDRFKNDILSASNTIIGLTVIA